MPALRISRVTSDASAPRRASDCDSFVRRAGRSASMKRRALKPSDLATLSRTVGEYPVAVRRVNRGGRPKADGSPREARPTTLKPETLEKLQAQGRERRLLYLLAVFTGLRRG